MKKLQCYGCLTNLLDVADNWDLTMEGVEKEYYQPEIIMLCKKCADTVQKTFEAERNKPVAFWPVNQGPKKHNLQRNKDADIDAKFKELIKNTYDL